MNILIAGGAGFIGSHLSAFHIDKGDTVFVVDNCVTGRKENIEHLLSNEHFHYFEEDVLKFNFSILKDIDVIYHLASPASPIQYKKYAIKTLEVNSFGTQKLLEYIKDSPKTRFVLASTSEVYGDPLIHPQVEEYWGNVNPIGVRACYDEAKRFAEAITMTYFYKYKLNLRIARIFNTYGPNMEQNDGRVVSNFIMQAVSNKPITIYGNGQQTRSFCYVSDLVRGLHLLGSTDNIAGEVINLGNPEEKTILELAHMIKEMTKTKSDIIFEPITADDPKKRKPNISKANRLLGWQPEISLTDGLTKTIQYFQSRFIHSETTIS